MRGDGPGETAMKKIIVGLSGASGVIYGIRLLEVLQALPDVETHLVMSTAAATTIPLETDYTPEAVRALAAVDYRFKDIAAAISSGSFRTAGMVVIIMTEGNAPLPRGT